MVDINYEIKSNVPNSTFPAYFSVRYSPIFQTSIDSDNYCCSSVKPVNVHDRVESYKFLSEFCVQNQVYRYLPTYLKNIS